MFETKELYSIYCSTGCTCCACENFTEGFYKSKEEAEKVIHNYSNGIDNPLASQYAKYGRYSLQTHKAEFIGDGRIIIDGEYVYNEDYFGHLDNMN